MSKAILHNLPNLTNTPQTEQARPEQVKNNAGGYGFAVSPTARLQRFLILGIDGGTYYVTEKDLFKSNYQFVVELAKRQPMTVLNTTVAVSESGRAYRNDAAIFVLALLFRYAPEGAKTEIRREFNKIVRTSTHLFRFCQYIEQLRDGTDGGWSRSKRRAVADWYQAKTPEQVAYQLVKYRQRDGWTHKDVLRLSHAVLPTSLSNFVLGKDDLRAAEPEQLDLIRGFKFAQEAQTISELLNVALTDYPNLPWEAVPTQFHKHVELWQKLFYNGQLQGQALLRNIVRLAKLKAFDDMVFARDVANKLTDEEMLRKTRLHPIQYLLTIVNYTEGQVQHRDNQRSYDIGNRIKSWLVNPVISDALDAGFYLAFKYTEPADKKTLIGLDVSSSMRQLAMGIDLSCAQVGAAMSMSVARREPYYQIMGFTGIFKDLGITPNMKLPEVMRRVQNRNFGATDCALPMTWAKDNKVDVDTFVIMTDNETWAGTPHPFQALEQYRQFVGHAAKLVVLGMAASRFSIANPADPGMLDIVGADSAVPSLVADFSAGRI